MKKRMKKMMAILLGFVMCVVLLAGCGQGQKTDTSNIKNTESNGTGKPLEGVKFKIAVNAENAPYETINTDGEYEGYTIDLIAAMADILGFEYEFSDMEFTGLISSVQTGRCDMVFSSISITDERKEMVDFTEGYFTPITTILTTKDSGITSVADLAGKKVGAAAGTRFLTYIQNLNGVKAISYDNPGNAVPVLGTGELDAIVESSSFTYEFLKKNEDKLKRIVIPASETEEWIPAYGVAFPKGSEYVEVFNKAFEQILNDGTNDKILAKWLGDDYVECLKEAQSE